MSCIILSVVIENSKKFTFKNIFKTTLVYSAFSYEAVLK